MSTSRFLVGLGLLVIAMAYGDFVTNTNPSNNVVMSIFYGFGSVAGSLLWGVIVWAGFRLARGKGAAPDIRKVSLYTATILILLFIVLSMFFGII